MNYQECRLNRGVCQIDCGLWPGTAGAHHRIVVVQGYNLTGGRCGGTGCETMKYFFTWNYVKGRQVWEVTRERIKMVVM